MTLFWAQSARHPTTAYIDSEESVLLFEAVGRSIGTEIFPHG
jgi:hypothetical protein